MDDLIDIPDEAVRLAQAALVKCHHGSNCRDTAHNAFCWPADQTARAILFAVLPVLRAQIEAEYETRVEYGHQLGRQWMPEWRGIKYATHQRTVHVRTDGPVLIDHWTYADHRHPVEGCTHDRHDLTTAADVAARLARGETNG